MLSCCTITQPDKFSTMNDNNGKTVIITTTWMLIFTRGRYLPFALLANFVGILIVSRFVFFERGSRVLFIALFSFFIL